MGWAVRRVGMLEVLVVVAGDPGAAFGAQTPCKKGAAGAQPAPRQLRAAFPGGIEAFASGLAKHAGTVVLSEVAVSYTQLRAPGTGLDTVCRLLL